jgi:4-amino-4-deoxy-L-arabinose transferase-like glycosyltransferase
MLSNIWVAVITGILLKLQARIIRFCSRGTFSGFISTPKSPLATINPSTTSIISSKWAIAWGFSLGIAFLLKQTALFFLFCPLAWALLQILKNRQWERLGQYLSGLLVAVAIFYPWYRTNWLLMLTSGKRATIDSALIEGDPSLTSLDAWTYYLKVLPYFLSWVLLIVPLVGFLLNRFYGGKKRIFAAKSAPIWLGVFLIGGYLFSSLNINKDARYILPLLPQGLHGLF